MSAHALLIGVTRFSDPQLSALRAPVSDVEALKAVLADPARGGFNVVTSIDDDLPTIRDKVSALLEDCHPDDMVLLYYSGHGIVDRSNCLFLATGETRAERPRARSLPSSEVREMMEQSRAKWVVVVLDCCHSGAFTEGAKGTAAAVNDRTFDPGEGAEGVYVLTATNAIQYALDVGTAANDGTAAQPSFSHFTSWLLDGLGRGEAAPDKPLITLDDLYTYLCRRARQSGAPMTPQRLVKRNSGEIVIARNPAAQSPSIPDEILAGLDSSEWKARIDALGKLKETVSKRATLRAAARKLLRDRMSSERDRDVYEAMMACLVELDRKEKPDDILIPPRPQSIGFWETRVLTRKQLDASKLSPPNFAELPRCARAWRNAHLMFWGSLGAALMIVASAASVLIGRLNKSSTTWIWIVAFIGLMVASVGLRIRWSENTLLNGRVTVLSSEKRVFERDLYQRACWVLIVACVVAAPLAGYRAFERAVTSALSPPQSSELEYAQDVAIGSAVHKKNKSPDEIGYFKFTTPHQPTGKIRVELRDLTRNTARPQLIVVDSDEREIFNKSEDNGNVVYVFAPRTNSTYYVIAKQAQYWGSWGPPLTYDIVVAWAAPESSEPASSVTQVSLGPRPASGSEIAPRGTNVTIEAAQDVPIGSAVHEKNKSPDEIRYFKFTTPHQPTGKIRVELRDVTRNTARPQLIVMDSDEREIFNKSEDNGNVVYVFAPRINSTYYVIAKQAQYWGSWGPPLTYDIVVARAEPESSEPTSSVAPASQQH